MEVTKPYIIRFGGMDVTKPYKCIGFGGVDVTKPYTCIWLGGIGVYVLKGARPIVLICYVS